MKIRFICPKHNVDLDGEPFWFQGDEVEVTVENSTLEHLKSEFVPWSPDLSDMSCSEGDGECQLGWEIHLFDDDGNVFAVVSS